MKISPSMLPERSGVCQKCWSFSEALPWGRWGLWGEIRPCPNGGRREFRSDRPIWPYFQILWPDERPFKVKCKTRNQFDLFEWITVTVILRGGRASEGRLDRNCGWQTKVSTRGTSCSKEFANAVTKSRKCYGWMKAGIDFIIRGLTI